MRKETTSTLFGGVTVSSTLKVMLLVMALGILEMMIPKNKISMDILLEVCLKGGKWVI